jgi:hypothetical protein
VIRQTSIRFALSAVEVATKAVQQGMSCLLNDNQYPTVYSVSEKASEVAAAATEKAAGKEWTLFF